MIENLKRPKNSLWCNGSIRGCESREVCGSNPFRESNKISCIVIEESYFNIKFMFLVMIHVGFQSRIHRNRGRKLVYSETLSASSCKLFFLP